MIKPFFVSQISRSISLLEAFYFSAITILRLIANRRSLWKTLRIALKKLAIGCWPAVTDREVTTQAAFNVITRKLAKRLRKQADNVDSKIFQISDSFFVAGSRGTHERSYSFEQFSGNKIRGSFHGNHLKRFTTRSGYPFSWQKGADHSEKLFAWWEISSVRLFASWRNIAAPEDVFSPELHRDIQHKTKREEKAALRWAASFHSFCTGKVFDSILVSFLFIWFYSYPHSSKRLRRASVYDPSLLEKLLSRGRDSFSPLWESQRMEHSDERYWQISTRDWSPSSEHAPSFTSLHLRVYIFGCWCW